MATIIGQWGLAVRDLRGQVGRTGGYVSYLNTSLTLRGDGQLLAFEIASQAALLSNGAPIRYSGLGGDLLLPNVLGATGDFPNAEDKAVLVFVTVKGTLHRFEIPAPVDGLFLADRETVDKSFADLVTLVSLMTASTVNGSFACDRSGIALSTDVAGFRSRRRFQRKTTIWTLDPTLAIPEE